MTHKSGTPENLDDAMAGFNKIVRELMEYSKRNTIPFYVVAKDEEDVMMVGNLGDGDFKELTTYATTKYEATKRGEDGVNYN